MEYPISKLNYSITDLLSSIETVRDTVQNCGLKNNIILTESTGGHNVLSEIDPSGQVYLSPSFCQFIWNVSYSALIVTDTSIILKELEKIGINRNQFLELISVYNSVPEVNFLMSELSAMPWEDVLKVGYECLYKKVTPKTENILAKIDISDAFSQKVNGLYQAAISFVLLHELFHWRNNHFRRGIKRIEMEKEADDYAFDLMLQHSRAVHQITYFIGPICTLISFFFINPKFNNKGNYPYEDERLFSQFDKLTSLEKMPCQSVIINILKAWAGYCCVKDFPRLTGYDAIDIDIIRKFLKTYNR